MIKVLNIRVLVHEFPAKPHTVFPRSFQETRLLRPLIFPATIHHLHCVSSPQSVHTHTRSEGMRGGGREGMRGGGGRE